MPRASGWPCFLTGVGTGIGAAALMRLLEVVQHLAGSGSGTNIVDAAEHGGVSRHVLVLLCAGLVTRAGQNTLKQLSSVRSLALRCELPAIFASVIATSVCCATRRAGLHHSRLFQLPIECRMGAAGGPDRGRSSRRLCPNPGTDIKKGDFFAVSTQGFCVRTTANLSQVSLKAGDDAKHVLAAKILSLTMGAFGIADHLAMIKVAKVAADALGGV